MSLILTCVTVLRSHFYIFSRHILLVFYYVFSGNQKHDVCVPGMPINMQYKTQNDFYGTNARPTTFTTHFTFIM